MTAGSGIKVSSTFLFRTVLKVVEVVPEVVEVEVGVVYGEGSGGDDGGWGWCGVNCGGGMWRLWRRWLGVGWKCLEVVPEVVEVVAEVVEIVPKVLRDCAEDAWRLCRR